MAYHTNTDTFVGPCVLITSGTSITGYNYFNQQYAGHQHNLYTYMLGGSSGRGDLYLNRYINTSTPTYLSVASYNSSIANYSTTTQMNTAITNANTTQDSNIASTYVSINGNHTMGGNKTFTNAIQLTSGADGADSWTLKSMGYTVAKVKPSGLSLERTDLNFDLNAQTLGSQANMKVNTNTAMILTDGTGDNATLYNLNFINTGIIRFNSSQIMNLNYTPSNILLSRGLTIASGAKISSLDTTFPINVNGSDILTLSGATTTISNNLNLNGNNLTFNADLTVGQQNTITFNHFGYASTIQATSAGIAMTTGLPQIILSANNFVDLDIPEFRVKTEPSGTYRLTVDDSHVSINNNGMTAKRQYVVENVGGFETHYIKSNTTNTLTGTKVIQTAEVSSGGVAKHDLVGNVYDNTGHLVDEKHQLISHNTFRNNYIRTFRKTLVSNDKNAWTAPSGWVIALAMVSVVRVRSADNHYIKQIVDCTANNAQTDSVNANPANGDIVLFLKRTDGLNSATSCNMLCWNARGAGLVGLTAEFTVLLTYNDYVFDSSPVFTAW